MSHYHDSDDLKVLGEFKKLARRSSRGSWNSTASSGAMTARSRGSIAS